MNKPPRTSLMGLLNRIGDATRAAHDADRRAHPERFAGAPDGLGPAFLFVEGVAHMLACNVDFVRRISRQDLPASKRGNRLIYQRADVEAYIRAGRDDGSSLYVPERKPAVQRVAKSGGTKSTPTADFDPVAHVNQLLKDRKS